IDDLEAGTVDETSLRVLRMKWPAAHITAAGSPDHHRTREQCSVARRGDVVGEHVVRVGDEVNELHLDHRPHAHVRGPSGSANDPGFRDRRVDYAMRSETLEQSLGRFERTSVRADVLAETEHVDIALHLF